MQRRMGNKECTLGYIMLIIPAFQLYTVFGKKRGHSILSITLKNLDTVS